MEKDTIFTLLKENLIDIMPELADADIQTQHSLKTLGANSIDRAEIIIQTMAVLKLKIPLVAFGAAADMGDIIDIFHQKASKACQ